MSTEWEDAESPVWMADPVSPLRLHHPLHAAGNAATGKPSRHMALRSGEQLLAAAQVGIRRWPGWGDFAVLARGPLWSPDLGEEGRRIALRSLLARLGADYRGVMAAPDPIGGSDPLGSAPWLAVMTPVSIAELALDAPPEVLKARQSPKWRSGLKRAEGAALAVRQGAWTPDPAHWLLKTEAEQRRRRTYKGADAAYTLGWAAAGGLSSTRLFTAQSRGRTVAAMLFLLHPPGATYHVGWCGETGRALGAHPLLLWRAMLWLAARGYSSLDLDVIDTETQPGLARFKLGAGARVVTLGATRLRAPGTGLVRRLLEHDGRGRCRAA